MTRSPTDRKLENTCRSTPRSKSYNSRRQSTGSSPFCTPKHSGKFQGVSGSTRLTRSLCKRQHRNGSWFTLTVPPGAMAVETPDRRKSTGSYNYRPSPAKLSLRRWANIDNVSTNKSSLKINKRRGLSNIQEHMHADERKLICKKAYIPLTNKQKQLQNRIKKYQEYANKYISVPKPFSLENSPSKQKLYIKCDSIPSSQSKPVVILHDLFDDQEQNATRHIVTVAAQSPNVSSRTRGSTSNSVNERVICINKDGTSTILCRRSGRPPNNADLAVPLEDVQRHTVSNRKLATSAIKRMFSPKPRPQNSAELSENTCAIL
ncbi:hypothetical protein KP79_PYT09667 [Mizuhopecten yessoensis]|uniref:Uncharacterized protein n=1 Tax=Mizuhopecten yessoensis TaxID=6573 RepID=A0A210PFC4_MIZYE|nr:hypothetical protein KP79_PYT09667 [Mizuhopecten yessoensis]